jgi:hypothetical protein
MARDNNLPFERGDTYWGIGAGDAITTAQSDSVQHLLGKEYVIEDPDYEGLSVTLKVVQYDGTGNLTATKHCVNYVDNGNYTKFTAMGVAAAGDFTHPLDHKYGGLVIRDLDLCYVVTDGPCECTGGATVSAMEPCAAQTDGELIASIAAHNYSVGMTIDALADGTVTTVLVGRANKTGA